MGETGVGKTSLVQYLSEVMDANFIRMPLHAGVEEATIFEDFDRVIKVAKNDKNKRTVVFLDEINTNEHISGLLKEIIVDRHFKGKIIPENISLVAACNPYKERTEEQMKATEQVGITHPKSSGRQRSKLVY
jgi:MoxR-like ATPase